MFITPAEGLKEILGDFIETTVADLGPRDEQKQATFEAAVLGLFAAADRSS